MISERAKQAGLKELSIFDNFQIDSNLPKHYAGDKIGNSISFSSTGSNDTEGGTSTTNVWIPTNEAVPSITLNEDGSYSYKGFRNGRIRRWLIRKLKNEKVEPQRVREISIVEFFTQITKSYSKLSPAGDIAAHYEKALVQSHEMGQTALLQKIKDSLDVVKGETILIAMNLKKYVSEKQVINFYEKVGLDKNLKLTWIKNFGRIIPRDIYLIKKRIDVKKIFDNYVILHYDPKNNGEKMTKEEIEMKKDPILFGVIKNSRKLYYVADWKDDYCELTLEEMFKHLKGRILTINNKSVKTYIDKIKI